MKTENLNKSITEIFGARYIIPLYQRNFAWREEQILRLLQDIYEAYTTNPEGNYFIGSLVVRKRHDDDFEVIDGQQRLTVLSLITRILGINSDNCLYYDSRPYVEEYLKAFYANPLTASVNHPSTTYLKEAVNTIASANLAEGMPGNKVVKLGEDENFAQYFANHVILVRVEIPEDTDVTTYFEIMNNRGEQLQEHEILKALLIGKMDDIGKQQEFALIWDACSQIDVPIQKAIPPSRRRCYFGDGFCDYKFHGLTESGEKSGEPPIGYTIEKILNGNTCGTASHDVKPEDDDIEFPTETDYSSIIDFPNFIMHLFKAFYEANYEKQTGSLVPLDSKYMLRVFDMLKDAIDPEEFIGNMLRTKTFFDRYVVRTVAVEESEKGDDDEAVTWKLIRPEQSGNKMYFRNTFEGDIQKRIVKALSMLQVTFRTRKYKNWLQEAIRWFAKADNISVNANEYITFLDEYILQRADSPDMHLNKYKPIAPDQVLCRNNSMSDGVRTPHFLFNLIDYLYWVERFIHKSCHQIPHTDKLKDFSFRYWNSVEHHLARKKAENIDGADEYIDNLGNLCLISKGANSRLNDRDVKEKVQTYKNKNMGANRQIMYFITEDHLFEWDEKDIRNHYNDLLSLLAKRATILCTTE